MTMDSEIETEYREKMNRLARLLDEFFNGDKKGTDRENGFALLVFKFGDADKSRCNYISNGASRSDMASLFREMAARFEGQPKTPTTRT